MKIEDVTEKDFPKLVKEMRKHQFLSERITLNDVERSLNLERKMVLEGLVDNFLMKLETE